MKNKLKVGVLAAVTLFAMTACGGSSDDGAGQLSSFQVAPTEASLASGVAACPGPDAKISDVLIIGGTAPYTIYSPNAQAVTFGPGGSAAPTASGTFQVQNRNSRFAVFGTGCFSLNLTVMDSQGRVAPVAVSAASGAGT